MFKRNVLAASLTLAALCSAQAALADINGGGATLPQPLYQTAGVLTAGFAPYIGVGSGNGKAVVSAMGEGQIKRVAQVHGNLVVLDLRQEETIFAGNRFVVYAMFPQCDISMHVMWGREKQNTVYTVGKSIFDRGNPMDVGALMLQYGGGGHQAAGTCQVDNDRAAEVLAALIKRINADG